MKKILFSIMSVCLVVLSCKKEHSRNTNPTQPLYKVAFNVGFSKQITNFKTNGSPTKTNGLITNSLNTSAIDTTLQGIIDVLYYAVYDASGNHVHTITQLSTDNSFGSYTDNLHAGTYTVVIAGGKTGMRLGPPLHTTTSNLNTDVIEYTDRYLNTVAFDNDAFFKKFSLTVSNTNTSQNISLDRIVSELTANIADTLPANAQTVELSITSGFAGSFLIGTAAPEALTSGSITVSAAITQGEIGTKNYKISALVMYASPLSADLFCSSHLPFDNPQLYKIAEKNIGNITCEPNRQTILSGNLFGGSGTTGSTGGFHIAIDTAWSPTTIVRSFP